ncbi:MAG: molybdopterin-dependent oxidoreductase [Verrucomicrobiales bacterium]|nr:molybdopterin-dependent oxidoreductase [Verrucomicrobiales bacterium]
MSNEHLSRRDFIQRSGLIGAGVAAAQMLPLRFLQAQQAIPNPLAHYPNRDWERIYRNQYAYDSTFSWVCAPNDTHNCRVTAHVRNGVITRMGEQFDVGTYADLEGNKASWNWGNRHCAKGYTFHRVIYGPYRLKHPIVRRGWKRWADDGFPYLTKELRAKYQFDSRGTDRFERLSWDDAFEYIAKGLRAIASRYSGEEGAQRLAEQGYPPEMIEDMGGAGTRTMKCRGGMGLLGVMGKYGMYRLSNSLALLDVQVRGVGEDQARGGRNWSNYTWHGDQAPGQPWVHGLQNSECDFNDHRFSKLIIMNGKNLVENKITDSHWFIECMERGAKIVVIAPEYGAPSTKSDYWVPVRPSTDAALWLGVTRLLMDNRWYDADFVKQFTDFPLLLRADNLRRLRAHEVFPDYQNTLALDGASKQVQGITDEQHAQLGDYVVWDARTNAPKAIHRDLVGQKLIQAGVDPVLDWTGKVRLADGSEVEVKTAWAQYQVHLEDYDLDSVAEITGAPRELVQRLAQDIATIKPASIHQGEGINHWFHATEANRAAYLPVMLTGNIGKPGAGCHGWAGNYKAALFQGSKLTGPGFKGWVAEDPFHPNLDEAAHGREVVAHAFTKDEEPAYWNHGDLPLIVDTPKEGRRCFTGQSHMPTPTKALLFTNVNLINNAKWAYGVIKNVNPRVELIVSIDIQATASVEYSDFALPANSWCEFEDLEITASCSNPFLQLWKGGIKPLYDTKDDLSILAGIAAGLSRVTGDQRFRDYFKFEHEGKRRVYIQRLLDTCTTTTGYTVEDIMAGKYGPPGGALLNFRTYPRIPFYEQIHDSWPFYTDTGRLHSYSDDPTAIECGENFIVHREGPEATPYLPNVIVSSNPWVRPNDFGIPLNAEHWDERTIRNVKLGWDKVKESKNFLWEKGYQFYCLTPKSRHSVHSSWANVDWHLIYNSNFGDPYRIDKRLPNVSEHQLHMNPQAARDHGLNDGDYVYVDANPADRPYLGATPSDPFYKVSRLMLRVTFNGAYPYHVVMMKHGTFIATEKTVKAQQTRPDGLSLTENGYIANFRFGSQQSINRNWHMPMHQTDTLFHKSKVFMSFLFGGEADNHAINTVPKECLVRITKAEDGGLGGKGAWRGGADGMSPDAENDVMKTYLAGDFATGKGGAASLGFE